MMRGAIVEDAAGLRALADEWRRLAVGQGNAFVTPEWFDASLRHYGDETRPFVPVALDADGRLAGLLPLVLRGGRLMFAGGNVGDRFEAVLAAGVEREAVRELAIALGGRRREWSLAVAHNVPRGSTWLQLLVDSSPVRLRTVTDDPVASPYIPIGELGWDGYLATRSANFRKTLRYKLQRLDREHGATFRAATATGLADDLRLLFALHDARWDESGDSSLTSPRARGLLADFATAAEARGWLRLWFLEAGGTPVAGFLGWQLGDRYAFYQTGFEPEWGRFSPGMLILAHTIEDAALAGAAEYDMLLGEEGYKSRFSDWSRQVETTAMMPAVSRRALQVALDVGARKLARRLLPTGARRALRRVAGPLIERAPTERVR